MKTLNEWLKTYGYKWVDGQERIYKAMLSAPAAQTQIHQLVAEGVVVRE
jgi:hypothetical protein